MKKIIILMMMLFSITVFAEKLTTDKKDNLDKLQGNWDSIMAVIEKRNNSWYYETSAGDISKLEKYKPGIFKIDIVSDELNIKTQKYERKHYIFYIAWDIKYKTLVQVDKEGNILSKEKRYIACIQNGTCN